MMNRIVALVLAGCAAIAAAAEISIASTVELPTANYVKNGNFSEKGKFWIGLKDKGGTTYDGECFQLEAASAANRGVYQPIRPEKTIPANVPMLIRYKSKKSGTDIERKPGSLALQLNYTNGKSQYLPVTKPPQEDHDWALIEFLFTTPAEVKAGTLYLTYYDQSGTQCYDEVEIYAGKTDITVTVTGDDAARVLLRHSVTGTIFAEEVKASPFSKSVSVPAFGSYCVEVLDKTGKVTSKLYPENIDCNVAASDTVIPLTTAKRIILKPNTPADIFTLDVTDMEKAKNAELNMKARLQKSSGFSGYANCLKIFVNGKVLGAKELLKPQNNFTTSAGKAGQFSGNAGFSLFYSAVFCSMNDENRYCPSSLPDKNPFEFKFAIGSLLQPGINKIEIKNSYRVTPKYNFDVLAENIFVELK